MHFYGPHGQSKEYLASGAPIPDGDFFNLTKEEVNDPHNKRLIEEGKILAAKDTKGSSEKGGNA